MGFAGARVGEGGAWRWIGRREEERERSDRRLKEWEEESEVGDGGEMLRRKNERRLSEREVCLMSFGGS